MVGCSPGSVSQRALQPRARRPRSALADHEGRVRSNANEQAGSNIYERLRVAVNKDFPQTPQYGASRAAGHQGNTDYLFERREFEPGSKP